MPDTRQAADDLTPNQRRFVAEYAIDRIATRAYLRAFGGGVAYKTAAEQARRLLEKPEIKAEVEAAIRDHARLCKVSALRVLREIAGVAFADVADAFADDAHTGLPAPRPLSQIPPGTRRAIQSVKVKRRRVRSDTRGDTREVEEVEEVEYRFASKLDALDKLCKHLGLTKDGAALEQLLGLLKDAPPGDRPADPTGGAAGGGG